MAENASSTIDSRHTAIVFFDMLKRHVYGPDLRAPLPEARGQVEACLRVLQGARTAGVPVFYACADHRPDGSDRANIITDRPRPDEAEATSRQARARGAWEVIDELMPQTGDYGISKHRWSMFFQTELELSLRARDIDTIVLAGGSTEVGIASSCYHGRDLDFNIVLVRDGLRSGRGRWVSDFFADEIAPGLARVRTAEQTVAMLGQAGGGGANAARSEGRSDIPGNTEATSSSPELLPQDDEPLDPRQTALVIFDQMKGNNYDHEDRRTVTPRAQAPLAACQRILEAARRFGIPVFFTHGQHRPDGADWASAIVDRVGNQVERFGRLRSTATTKESWAAEFVDELPRQPGDYIVNKHRYSAFHGTPLELSLRTRGVTNILLVGGSTSIGLASTAYSARDRDFNVVVLQDACRSTSPPIGDYFMDHIFPRLGRVRTVDQAIKLLKAD